MCRTCRHLPAGALEGVTEAELAVADSYLQPDSAKLPNEAATAPAVGSADNSTMLSDDQQAPAAGAAAAEIVGTGDVGENCALVARDEGEKNIDDDLKGMADSEGYVGTEIARRLGAGGIASRMRADRSVFFRIVLPFVGPSAVRWAQGHFSLSSQHC